MFFYFFIQIVSNIRQKLDIARTCSGINHHLKKHQRVFIISMAKFKHQVSKGSFPTIWPGTPLKARSERRQIICLIGQLRLKHGTNFGRSSSHRKAIPAFCLVVPNLTGRQTRSQLLVPVSPGGSSFLIFPLSGLGRGLDLCWSYHAAAVMELLFSYDSHILRVGLGVLSFDIERAMIPVLSSVAP